MIQDVIRILRLGRSGDCAIFDFVEVPQGYIHLCATGVPKPKRSRKFPHVNGVLIDPTDDQVKDYARLLMSRSDIYNTSSEKNPENYIFDITSTDFRDKNGRGREIK